MSQKNTRFLVDNLFIPLTNLIFYDLADPQRGLHVHYVELGISFEEFYEIDLLPASSWKRW